jgi:hypothetical protein
MTKLLQDVLHERAENAPRPQVDLDRVIGAGERRVRRARLGTGLAACVVAAVVAGSAFALPGMLAPQPQRHDAAAAPSPWSERRAGYAMEDVVHRGDESFSVGAVVVSYVQTDDGIVFTTRNGDVWRYGGADSQRIGHAAGNRLRADDTGSLVAWVDGDENHQPQYVVYDTHAGKEVARVDDLVAGPARPGAESDGGALVYAVDDGSVYWRTGEDIVRYDVATGDTDVVTQWVAGTDSSAGPQVIDLVDVAAGRLAYLVTDKDGRGGFFVGDQVGEQATELPSGRHGYLSPDGGYAGVEEDDVMAVYDTATGAEVTPDLPGYPFTVVTGWVDADTAAVIAIKDLDADPYAFDMLACDVPSGVCEVVSGGQVATDAAESLVAPTGDPMT